MALRRKNAAVTGLAIFAIRRYLTYLAFVYGAVTAGALLKLTFSVLARG